jgi:hypothetical protein
MLPVTIPAALAAARQSELREQAKQAQLAQQAHENTRSRRRLRLPRWRRVTLRAGARSSHPAVAGR